MRPRVLIVEDDAATREALARLVEGEGCDVDLAPDGGRAVGLLERQRYDMALIDIVLPKLSGTDLLEYILSAMPDLLSRVVVVTGLEVAEIRKLFPTILDVLSKPVLPSRLSGLVRRCIVRPVSGVSVA